METFESTVTVRRPVEVVFAFLADFENVPMWNVAIERTTKVTSGPLGVGTRYRQIRTTPRRRQEAFEVTVFDPPRRVAIEGEIGPFRARLGYLLEPVGEETRLTNTAELEPSSVPSRLLAPLAASRIKAAVATNLNQLKLVLESGHHRSD